MMNKSFFKKTILGLSAFSVTFLGYSTVSTALSSKPQLIAHPNHNHNYSTTLVNDYMDSCKQGATEAGLSAADAAELCSCMMDEFQSRYSESRFQELNRQAQQGDEPSVFQEVGMSCYAEMM